MKIFLFTITIILFPTFGWCQVSKFKAKQSTIVLTDSSGRYVNGMPMSETDFLVVFNMDEKKISVYEGEPSKYDIATITSIYTDNLGSKWVKGIALTEKGAEVRFRFVYYKKPQDDIITSTLYIDFIHACFIYRLSNA